MYGVEELSGACWRWRDTAKIGVTVGETVFGDEVARSDKIQCELQFKVSLLTNSFKLTNV